MGIPHDTVTQLYNKEIIVFADLIDFDKSTIDQIYDNLCHQTGRISDHNLGAAPGATIHAPLLIFGINPQNCLVLDAELLCYYKTVGRSTSAANIQWNPVMENFELQWKPPKENKKRGESEVPKITKAFLILKWTEAFTDYTNRKIGARTIP